ncbi:MAG: hypothetical protein GQ532_06330 [Methylomarinum sp.]|nr:hypothetical protein [Methylomarinum sp.]
MGDREFKNHAEIWNHLLKGEEITDKNPNDKTRIRLFNGVPKYSNGKSAENCLFTPYF